MKFLNNIKPLIYLIVLLVFTQCRETSWYENYRENEKSPFGTYIIYNELPALFNNKEVIYLKENIYDYLSTNYYKDEENPYNYICINDDANKINNLGIEDLKEFVSSGNNVFLSLNYFSNSLKDELNIETTNLDPDAFTPKTLSLLKGELLLKNKDFKQKYTYDRNMRRNYFSSYNSNSTSVLGTQIIDGTEEPIFLRIYYGKGSFYIHTQPNVFTNYFLIKNDNHDYAENALSYLPNSKILWDPQRRLSSYRPNDNNQENSRSVFSFFIQNPSLKWSLFIGFFGLLTFIAFNTRRKQRPIPIIKELENSTVQFTHTIGNLYLKEEDHKNLIDKKITYFLEKVRTKYLIKTNNLNSDFIEKLAHKSGNTQQTTNFLINTIIQLNKKSECTQNEVIRLNNLIENFFEKK